MRGADTVRPSDGSAPDRSTAGGFEDRQVPGAAAQVAGERQLAGSSGRGCLRSNSPASAMTKPGVQ